jgi:glucokinase
MKLAIGIDLGGTNVKGVVINESGNILNQHTIPTNDDEGKWRENILAMVNFLTNAADDSIEVIGIAGPGLANAENKYIAHLPNRLSGLEGFLWEDYFSKKTFVINDAHAALIAEAKFGAAKGYKNVVLLTLGTGVGGGILINGELYQVKWLGILGISLLIQMMTS